MALGWRGVVSADGLTVGTAVTVRMLVGVGEGVGAGVSVSVAVGVDVTVAVVVLGGRVGAGSPGSRKVAQARTLSASMAPHSSR